MLLHGCSLLPQDKLQAFQRQLVLSSEIRQQRGRPALIGAQLCDQELQLLAGHLCVCVCVAREKASGQNVTSSSDSAHAAATASCSLRSASSASTRAAVQASSFCAAAAKASASPALCARAPASRTRSSSSSCTSRRTAATSAAASSLSRPARSRTCRSTVCAHCSCACSRSSLSNGRPSSLAAARAAPGSAVHASLGSCSAGAVSGCVCVGGSPPASEAAACTGASRAVSRPSCTAMHNAWMLAATSSRSAALPSEPCPAACSTTLCTPCSSVRTSDTTSARSFSRSGVVPTASRNPAISSRSAA
eukprot:Rhum_TRINITY_DN13025_c0_g1::Rhum_TRINITY_DN13025_c0_g1_i1::g.56339::m.56339